MKLFEIAILGALAACGGKPADAGACGPAIDHAMSVSRDAIKKLPNMSDAVIARMTAITLAHCDGDKWPVAVVACLAGGKDNTETDACMKALPGELTVRWQNAMATAVINNAPAAGSGSAAP